MRGYGEISEQLAGELNSIVDELKTSIKKLNRFITQETSEFKEMHRKIATAKKGQREH